MLRKSVVSGQFYPDSKSSIESMMKELIDESSEKKEVFGVMSPHAGYVYSGKVAGEVYSQIQLSDSFIIIGPNHTGYGSKYSIMTSGQWETPLGKVDVDSKLACQILSNSSYLKEDEMAHVYEHSIEVQLPFIQYLKKDFSFVPMILTEGDINIYRDIGMGIGKAIKLSGKKTIIVASSDMTHYEEHKVAKEKDRKAIEAVLNLDEEELLSRVREYDITMCGYIPTIVMIVAAKELGAKKAKLIDYKTSGDTSGDYSSVVGYAGAVLF